VMTTQNGALLYHGPSQLDGSDIVAIATGLANNSHNSKTGAMIQTWVMRTDTPPKAAQDNGTDASVCGNCPLRPVNNSGARCYVKTWQAPRSVLDGFHRGIYQPVTDWSVFAGLKIRIGSYGDPAAVPAHIWKRLIKLATHHTGYTHQWRSRRDATAYLMASVESPAGRGAAKAKGYRTFRTKRPDDPVLPGEISCPASKEAGHKTTCARCRLCGGAGVRAKDIVINIH
jgi:hypothetical protein